MLPKQVVSYSQLVQQGLGKNEITKLIASLRLFPTPFKGIYYVPMEVERKGTFIEKPLMALTKSIELFLGTDEFYISCSAAEEFWGSSWQPSGKVHIVNCVRSGRIDLKKRIENNIEKGTYRAKKIAKLLSFYGNEISFHKTKSIEGCKIKQTPYGRFAYKSQIRIDRKRFRCKK
jgi:hypothetical protein